MILATVVGRVWPDRRLEPLEGARLLTCRSLGDGSLVVAVDLVDAAVGTTVLLMTDDAAAAVSPDLPTDAAIVAIVGGMDPID